MTSEGIEIYCRMLKNIEIDRSSHQRCSIKKAILKIFRNIHRKHLCWSLFLIKLQTLLPTTYEKETSTQVFPCEYCENLNSTYFEEHLRIRTLKQCVKFASLHKKIIFLTRILRQIWPDPQETADLVTFTKEILNRKLHFLSSTWWTLEVPSDIYGNIWGILFVTWNKVFCQFLIYFKT